MSLESKARPPLHRSLLARLRSWFFTGLVVFGPLAVTIYVAWWVIDTIDNWVRPLAPASLWPDNYFSVHVPGFGVIIVLIGLTLLGFLTANIAGRTLVGLGENLLDRTPVVRGLYKSVKQIFETVFSQDGTQFRKVGLVEFPIKGSWSIVFITTDPPTVVSNLMTGIEMTSVFLPCTPNPTTGFYFFVPTKDIIELPMTPDDAAKLVMSAGLIQPDAPTVLGGAGERAGQAARELPEGGMPAT